MREIVVDTETTGLDPADGHRIVEIAALELFNHMPTGRVFHRYVNPQRAMPEEARRVHGLSDVFLAQHDAFDAVADGFLEFIAGDKLVIHNAGFDIAFINAELTLLGKPALSSPYQDTLSLARQRFPGSPASLDALCKRFGIDNSARDKHGARLDCELLASVYLELIGGRQPGLELVAARVAATTATTTVSRIPRAPRVFAPTAAELERHRAFLAKLKAPIWLEA
ncbi:MAG TPA: DNA polymerase III subunit epsilon [Stellaceae bacterium]|nr:DNA polymerase III subunit epsilon [Stellaceae bacterium]